MKMFQTLFFSLFLLLTAAISAEEALTPLQIEAQSKARAELDKIELAVEEQGQKRLFVFSGFENLTAKSIVIKRDEWGWFGTISLPNSYVEFFMSPNYISVLHEVDVRVKDARSTYNLTGSNSYKSFWIHTIEIDSLKVEERNSTSLTLSADVVADARVKNLNEELLIP